MANKKKSHGKDDAVPDSVLDKDMLIDELKKRILCLEDGLQHMQEELEVQAEELESQLEELRVNNDDLIRVTDSLRDSESKYRIVADNTYDWEFWLDPDGSFKFVSPSCERITGYSADEFLKDNGLFVKIIHPIDRRSFVNHQEGEAKKRLHGELEYRIITKDGKTSWISHVCNPIIDDKGRFLGTRGANQDITERKHAEEAHSQLAAIVEASNDAIISKTIDGIITSWNRGAERVYGYKSDEVVGKPISILAPSDLPDEIPHLLKRIRFGEDIIYYDTKRVRKDGTVVDVSLTLSPIKDISGRIMGVATIARDITERKRNEEALRDSEVNLKRAQEIAHIGSWTWDIPSDKVMWSDESFRIYGMVPGEVKPSYELFLSFIIPIDRENVDKEVRKALLTGSKYSVIYRIIRRDGVQRFLISENEVVTDDSGKVVKMYGTNHDITEHKRAEDKLAHVASFPELNPAPIFEVDDEGTITYSNPAANRLFPDLQQKGINHPMLKGITFDIFSKGEIKELTRDVQMNDTSYQLTIRYLPDRKTIRIYTIDITERKHTEESLRESDERFRALGDNIPNLAWMANADGWIFWYNKQWYDYTGTTPEEMQGWGWQKVHHPDYVDAVTKEWSASIASGKPYDNIFPLRGKDGNYRWFLTRIRPIKDEHGNIQRWFGTNTDITDRQRAEEALRENEANLSRAERIANVGYWDWDLTTNKVKWSDGHFRIFGYPIKHGTETLDMFTNRVHPDDADNLENALQKGMTELKSYKVDYRVVWPDGSIRYVHAEADKPLKDATGKSVRWFGIVQDITERKKAEEVLSESEKNLLLAQNIAHLGFWVWNLSDDILEWSDEVYRIFRYMPREFQPNHKSFLSLVHPIDRERFNNAIQDALEGKKPYNIDLHILRKDGSTGYIHSEGELSYKNGNPVRMFGIILDITERKRAEKEKEITVEFLKIVNEARSTRELVRSAVGFFQKECGCEAVGIRLREGDDYPYYEARGFSPKFISKENLLCTRRDGQGRIIRDKDGFPMLDCMCGNVITGRFDSSKPFFTARGSFWTNSTTELLATTTENDRLANTRNVCNTEGYESFALIALRVGEERLGVLQLNDRRKGHFTLEQITMWERLSDYIAVALAKSKAEEALKESEEKLKLAIDGANMGMWDWHIQTGELIWSNRCKKIFGLSPETVMDYDLFLGAVHPHDRERIDTAVMKALDHKEDYDSEMRVQWPDGTVHWVVSKGRGFYDAKGKALRMVGIALDITESKQSEEELKIAKEQAELYLDLMGHDISNMHQIIMGQLELAQELLETDCKLDAVDKKLIDTSLETLERSAKLIDNVRNLQKLSHGEFKEEVIDLDNLLSDVIKEFDVIVPTESIKFAGNGPHYVKANKLLHDVFTNLVGNAIKHSNKNNVHTVIRLDNDSENGKDYYRVSVEDNGPGITDDMKVRVFHRLQRGKTEARGVGLGLYLVKTLVESFGGFVKVEDRVQGDYTQGAKFLVYLPIMGGE
jgi:PAS domain S-box-containing protein